MNRTSRRSDQPPRHRRARRHEIARVGVPEKAGSKATLEGGLGRKVYAAALALLAFIGLAIAGLVVRALVTGEFAGALFLTGSAALIWQVDGFVRRNRPLAYDLEHLPQALLP